jgi:hypothetical protein
LHSGTPAVAVRAALPRACRTCAGPCRLSGSLAYSRGSGGTGGARPVWASPGLSLAAWPGSFALPFTTSCRRRGRASPAGRALARLDALTEELANRRAELAAEKQRQSANRRWAIGAVITAAAAVSAIVSAVAAVIVHVH